jgi:xylulokinase
MVNAIPLDIAGDPIGPCISWLDGRAWEEAQLVMRKVGGSGIFSVIVGSALTGKDLLPKYLWIKRNQPELYKQSAAIVDCASYLLFKATGRLVYDWSTASVTGLFNLRSKTWDTGLMRFFGLRPEKFPPLVKSHERVGELTVQAAAELGLPAGLPVFAGAGDGMTAAVGSGAVREGEAHLCLGTSGFVGIVTARRLVGRRGIVTIQSADPEKFLLIAETETAGSCLRWAIKEIYGLEPKEESFARMNEDIDSVDPGSADLIFTPWMYGERCPVADESLRAAFINLGANHTRQQMARAVYEGVAYNIRWILDSISRYYGFLANPLRVLGGGALSDPWMRIMADVSGRSLEIVPHPQEISAIGAALIAAVGLGIYPNYEALKSLVPVERVVQPASAPRATYDRLYRAYRQVYQGLRGIYHGLNRAQSTL